MTFSLVMAGLVVFSLFWGIIFGIFYYRDLAHYHEPPLKKHQLALLPLGISYMYVILFFSIIMAYWRWSFRQNSWIKTEHGKNVS